MFILIFLVNNFASENKGISMKADLINKQLEETDLNQYLVIQIADNSYALSILPIKEIVIAPEATPMPNSPEFVRGLIKLRQNIITLIDSRKRLGFRSILENGQELFRMLQERKQDHINWLQTLYTAVEKDGDFNLTTDPHACAFGRWYDNFKTDNYGLEVYLRQFDAPHKRIHAIATRALKEKELNGKSAAIKIIEQVKNTDLKAMIDLFDNAEQAIKEARRELAIILEHNNSIVAITADNVSNIVSFEKEQIQQSELNERNQFLNGSVNINGDIILVIDIDRFVNY